MLGTAVRRRATRRERRPGADRAVGRRLRQARCAPASSRSGSSPGARSSSSATSYADAGAGSAGCDGIDAATRSSATSPRASTARASGRWARHRTGRELGASGVVGVRIGHTIRRASRRGMAGGFGGASRGMMVTFHAIGTAIRAARRISAEPIDSCPRRPDRSTSIHMTSKEQRHDERAARPPTTPPPSRAFPRPGARACSRTARACSPPTCRSTSSCSSSRPASSRWAWSSAARSTTSASRWPAGRKARR